MKTGSLQKRNLLAGLISLFIITQTFIANGQQQVWIKTNGPTAGCSPWTQQFLDSAAAGFVVQTWFWDFGDGTISTLHTPVYVYNNPGVYNVRLIATDLNGISDTDYTTITVYPTPSSTLSAVDVSCYGACNGAVNSTITGGTLPYSYLWSPPPASTTPSITGLCPGLYYLTVLDSNGCGLTDSAVVTEPAALTFTVSITDPTPGNCDGTAAFNVTGGTPPVHLPNNSPAFPGVVRWSDLHFYCY